MKSPTKSRIVFLKNSSSKSSSKSPSTTTSSKTLITIKNTENIQVTVHSDHEIKKVTTTDDDYPSSIVDDKNSNKSIKKPIRRKVYLNKQKPLEHTISSTSTSLLKVEEIKEDKKKKIELKSLKSIDDESNFEPNYFDEEFEKTSSSSLTAKISC